MLRVETMQTIPVRVFDAQKSTTNNIYFYLIDLHIIYYLKFDSPIFFTSKDKIVLCYKFKQ